ncbi:unnamed protein product [Menidia menidia]|uniref:(Atlantic silverside) hypothetical protein n=1 Tax=Menidia menidia TaxID=238744 RepID=A0A8S4BMP0_9TELE|nr:unnamed protein product [Menidia menidia]
MAASVKRVGNPGIFWMNGVSDDEEQPLAFVPGVDGGRKTPFILGSESLCTYNKKGTKMRTQHSSDRKNPTTQKTGKKTQGHLQSVRSGTYSLESVPLNQSMAVATEKASSQPPDAFPPLAEKKSPCVHPLVSETSRAKSEVSLKDLCPEDKRRIANLIEELARVSEEKEESMQRLKDEQGNFERKIQQLEQQNVIIAQERGSLQQQYRECQELLGLYQQYLSQQQARLNESISQLSQQPNPSKVLGNEEVPSWTSTGRANGSPVDGSYLSRAPTAAQQAHLHRSGEARRGGEPAFRNLSSLPCDCESSPTGVPQRQHLEQIRECRKQHSCYRCKRGKSSPHDICNGTQQGRSVNVSHRGNGHHDALNQRDCERLQSGSVTDLEALSRPVLGHEDWEEKRHQLLLQKMQLEMERERLHARLAEQEERLNRQTEQLRQSRLDYSRIPQSTLAEPSTSNAPSGRPEPEDPTHQNLPSSASFHPEGRPAEQNLHEKHTQTVPAPSASGNDHLKGSRKDMATTPAKSPAGTSKTTQASVMQKSPEAKLDFSMVELLDIFSPISAPEHFKPGARRPKTSQHRSTLAAPKSASRILLTPGGPYPRCTRQDLEEGQILEDIFFIC